MKLKKEKSHGFDSDEELYFSWYCEELKQSGIITEYIYQPESYVLSEPIKVEYEKPLKTKSKTVSVTIMQGHSYTADFKLVWSDDVRGVFFEPFTSYIKNAPFIANQDQFGKWYSVADVKPFFDKNNMTRAFIINQKWLMQKFNVFCQKIILINKNLNSRDFLFNTTFTPERFKLTTVSKKPRKIAWSPKTLSEFVDASKKKQSQIQV